MFLPRKLYLVPSTSIEKVKWTISFKDVEVCRLSSFLAIAVEFLR